MRKEVSKSEVYDVAKCIATVLVVVAHATRMYTPSGAVPVINESVFLAKFTDYIYAFHMPLFMLLSGCVYGYCLEKKKYNDNRAFIYGKVKKLLVPYLFFGVFYVAPTVCLLGIVQGGFVKYIIKGIFLGTNSRHLGYVLALFWIFVLFMLIKPLVEKKKYVVVAVISIVLLLLSYKMPSYFQAQAALRYQFFFFAGMLFNLSYEKFNVLCTRIRGFSILFAALLLLMFVYNPNEVTILMYSFVGIAATMFGAWGICRWIPHLMDCRIYREFKKNAFGIYLFHPMIIYVMFYFWGQYNISPIILSIVVILCSMILSFGATNLIRKMHMKILIGE